jgi:hypothetical protein
MRKKNLIKAGMLVKDMRVLKYYLTEAYDNRT